MLSLVPRVELNGKNGGSVSLIGDTMHIQVYTSVQPFDGTAPIWFSVHQDVYTKISYVPSLYDGNVFTSTMDPITAVLRGLVTPDQVKMPAGLQGLLALLKPV